MMIRRACLALFLVWLAPDAAMAERGLAGNRVQGIELVRDGAGAAVVAVTSEPTFLSGARICGLWARHLPELNTQLKDRARALANPRMPKGFSIRSDATSELTARCTALATVRSAAGGNISVNVKLPGNRFVFYLTKPGAIPGGRETDPKFSIGYDLEANIVINVPTTGASPFGLGQVVFAITNVDLAGENVVGDIALALKSVADFFAGRDLAASLTKDRLFRFDGITASLKRFNDALPGLRQMRLEHGYNPAKETLVLRATSRPAGARVVDDRCIAGFVWRNVTSKDRVCVKPEVRTQVRLDNQLAEKRRNGKPTKLAACPRVGSCLSYKIPCMPGFVWREAVPDDYVCVTPQTRAQAQDDNKNAARRRMDWEAVVQ